VSRRHGVAQSLLFYWRRLARDGQLGPQGAGSVLMPVEVVASEAEAEAVAPVSPDRPAPRRGVMEIELGGGRRVRVDADVDACALRRVLGVLEGR